MSNIDRYLSGDYIKKNHSYHIEDSEFKWKNFLNILKNHFKFKNKFNFDIGCGSGQIFYMLIIAFFNNKVFLMVWHKSWCN